MLTAYAAHTFGNFLLHFLQKQFLFLLFTFYRPTKLTFNVVFLLPIPLSYIVHYTPPLYQSFNIRPSFL